MGKKVTLSGFPEVGYTAKIGIGKDQHVFIKLGTGEMLGSDDFVIEIPGEPGEEVTAGDVAEALRAWTRQVEEVMLSELHRHSEQVRQRLKQAKL